VRRAAARAQCAHNLKQIALGLLDYADTHPAMLSTGETPSLLPAGTAFHPVLLPEGRLSWFAEVLPFIEQGPLHRRLDFKAGWDAEANAAARSPLKILQCPDWVRESEPLLITAQRRSNFLQPQSGLGKEGLE
jgi:hypothetical protein